MKNYSRTFSRIGITVPDIDKKGWGYVGPAGAGHYVKMVHSGIEYGMMQAFSRRL